jgi:hypothetical protein
MADSAHNTNLFRRALMSVGVGLVTANVAAAAIAVRAAQAMAPAASVWLSREPRRDPGPKPKLHSFHHEDEMTDEGRQQFNELKASMRAANGVEAVEAELMRRGAGRRSDDMTQKRFLLTRIPMAALSPVAAQTGDPAAGAVEVE